MRRRTLYLLVLLTTVVFCRVLIEAATPRAVRTRPAAITPPTAPALMATLPARAPRPPHDTANPDRSASLRSAAPVAPVMATAPRAAPPVAFRDDPRFDPLSTGVHVWWNAAVVADGPHAWAGPRLDTDAAAAMAPNAWFGLDDHAPADGPGVDRTPRAHVPADPPAADAFATLPRTGPYVVPGDPALTAALAETWPEYPAPAAAAADAAGTDAGRLRDEHGVYREAFATVTAYCPCTRCCGPMAHGVTSTGKNAWSRGLAADPKCLDYGTRVFVPGYGLAVVDDTGGAMRQSWRRRGRLHLDLRMTYHWEGRQWGRKYMVVRVYEPES